MKNIIAILDRSGSMSGTEIEVMNAYNAFIEDQKKLGSDVNVTLVLFDDKYRVVYSDLNINLVGKLDNSVYTIGGMTALYDAIGKTISRDIEGDALVLIMTDGYENSSKEYANIMTIRGLMDEKKEKGWKFEFIGADISVTDLSISLGVTRGLNTTKGAPGMNTMSAFMSASASHYLHDTYSKVANTGVLSKEEFDSNLTASEDSVITSDNDTTGP